MPLQGPCDNCGAVRTCRYRQGVGEHAAKVACSSRQCQIKFGIRDEDKEHLAYQAKRQKSAAAGVLSMMQVGGGSAPSPLSNELELPAPRAVLPPQPPPLQQPTEWPIEPAVLRYGLVPPPPPPLMPQLPLAQRTSSTPPQPPTVHSHCTVGTQVTATALWVEELIDPDDLYDGPDEDGFTFRTDYFPVCDELRLKLNRSAGELAYKLLYMLHGEAEMEEASMYQPAERYARDPQGLFLSMDQLPWFTNFLADMLMETKSEARLAVEAEEWERERRERAEAFLAFMKADSPGMFSVFESRFQAASRGKSFQ